MKPWFPFEIATQAPVSAEPAPAQLDPYTTNVRTCLFVSSLFALVAAVILPSMVGMRVNIASILAPLEMLPSVAILWVWASWRGRPQARAAAELALTPLFLSLLTLVFSYSAAHFGVPLQDARLEAWDAALGFSSLDFIAWIDRHPLLANVLRETYGSFFLQMLVLPTLLVLVGRLDRAYAMVFVILLLGVIGAFVSIFFPAVGAYVHHGIPDGSYANIAQGPGYFNAQLEAVRSDPNFVLDVTQAEGIVAFPSGHAAIAVLCAWTAWPVRWVRWPFLAINACMLASAIPQGAHYLVDLIAGAAMCGVSILIATHLPRAFGRGAGAPTDAVRSSQPALNLVAELEAG